MILMIKLLNSMLKNQIKYNYLTNEILIPVLNSVLQQVFQLDQLDKQIAVKLFIIQTRLKILIGLLIIIKVYFLFFIIILRKIR